ncbi:hypothetical protein KP509_35G031000 [Ceratopteris richardii]|uniref:Trichome birefringence-like N-terminal domain-containing protein n=1 Tax=Ceratopteris richardii TaxID=49495 RepID=A0A8T2QEZ3_CERRI|nr:hypothetical protein KP509_35G031000 [Ceratopteris richardii]
MVCLSNASGNGAAPCGLQSLTAMKRGCSVVMLCVAAIGLITFGLGVMSVRFRTSAISLRTTILCNLLPSLSTPPSSSLKLPTDSMQNESFHSTGHDACDLWSGRWVEDRGKKAVYNSSSCPVLTPTQDCEGNGRPDQAYISWRWEPWGCQPPEFNAELFFRLLRGKTIAFVGDSVARNHMEALMCILWQTEVPENRGSKKMQKWYFRAHSVTVIRIWSAWLVNVSIDAFDFAPADLVKLHLEQADTAFMDVLPRLDVMVISCGHWFAKKAAFVRGGRVVGGQLWGDRRLPSPPLSSSDAFSIAMETALTAIAGHAQFKGLTILRTYSPDHYEGGAWNTGGSCADKVRPLNTSEIVHNPYTDLMRRHQLEAFTAAQLHIKNSSKLRLLDVTPVFAFRPDGHPGPYRSRGLKVNEFGVHGKLPPQDCLHWCMPGPIDTWNDLLLELLKRELLTMSA